MTIIIGVTVMAAAFSPTCLAEEEMVTAMTVETRVVVTAVEVMAAVVVTNRR
ncbi:MAG: hypothetical protein SFT92_01210 [Rickettsiales bacterium]|nr:hypothetical protein [Rickettsiales bacterium]